MTATERDSTAGVDGAEPPAPAFRGAKAGRLLPLLPPAILVLIAVAQLVLVDRAALTPWKGGGFGMFSTADRGNNRRLRIWVHGPERDEERTVPAELVDEARRALTLPSERRLRALVLAIAEEAATEEGTIERARIAVWRREYDARTLAAHPEPLRDLTVGLADAAD